MFDVGCPVEGGKLGSRCQGLLKIITAFCLAGGAAGLIIKPLMGSQNCLGGEGSLGNRNTDLPVDEWSLGPFGFLASSVVADLQRKLLEGLLHSRQSLSRGSFQHSYLN